MSKAEDRALEKYPVLKTVLGDTNYLPRICFIEGYHQAEKDNALSWEDLRCIHRIYADTLKDTTDEDFMTEKYYREVLRRFLELKGGNV